MRGGGLRRKTPGKAKLGLRPSKGIYSTVKPRPTICASKNSVGDEVYEYYSVEDEAKDSILWLWLLRVWLRALRDGCGIEVAGARAVGMVRAGVWGTLGIA